MIWVLLLRGAIQREAYYSSNEHASARHDSTQHVTYVGPSITGMALYTMFARR